MRTLTLVLMATLLSSNAMASEYSVRKLNAAIRVCDRELSDASSGQWTSWRASTIRRVIGELRGLLSEARVETRSNVTSDLIDMTDNFLVTEDRDSRRWESYTLTAVSNLFTSVRAKIRLAAKYDPQNSCAQ